MSSRYSTYGMHTFLALALDEAGEVMGSQGN